MSKTYTVSPRSEAAFSPFTVEAQDYNEAASKVAKKLYKADRALRVTGDPGKSGVFQSYKDVRGQQMESSVGGNFHLIEQ